MSVFVVDLTRNVGNGIVSDPAIDADGVSLQRTMWCNGANLTWRKLNDGEIFTDCNYWKRYAPISEGGASDESIAFIHILSDDGSPFDDHNPQFNTFAVVEDLVVVGGTTFTLEANQLDILSDHGGFAHFTQIVTDEPVTVRLNGSSDADLDVAAGSQVFDNGDLSISSLAFDNSASGASDATVQVLLSIITQCAS